MSMDKETKHEIEETVEKTLLTVCGVKRQSGSEGEAQIVAWFASKYTPTMIDLAGNLHFDRRGGASRTLFTAHSDTMHRGDGVANPIRITQDRAGRWLRSAEDGNALSGNVLGADDGAGMAILAAMMDQDVPGYYILFRQEEVGGRGSMFFARQYPGMGKDFDRAIAFDRMGYGDIITHQLGYQCCSLDFAEDLAAQLNNIDEDFMYKPCEGVFTDTANLTDMIPECTNISVGYFHEHTQLEMQNITHLIKVAQAVVQLDWEDLPIGVKDQDAWQPPEGEILPGQYEEGN